MLLGFHGKRAPPPIKTCHAAKILAAKGVSVSRTAALRSKLLEAQLLHEVG